MFQKAITIYTAKRMLLALHYLRLLLPTLYCLFAIITVYMLRCTSITLRCPTQAPFIFISKDQGGNVVVHVEQPIHVHFTDEEKVYRWDEEDDLQTETVEEKLKTGTDEGSSVSHDEGSSVSHDEGTCRSLWQINQLKQCQIIDSLT